LLKCFALKIGVSYTQEKDINFPKFLSRVSYSQKILYSYLYAYLYYLDNVFIFNSTKVRIRCRQCSSNCGRLALELQTWSLCHWPL